MVIAPAAIAITRLRRVFEDELISLVMRNGLFGALIAGGGQCFDLTANEVKWLNAYHARVRKTVSPLVDAVTRRWLSDATRRLDVKLE